VEERRKMVYADEMPKLFYFLLIKLILFGQLKQVDQYFMPHKTLKNRKEKQR
jgi:hypothetical protein